jgi:steroid 5-alpha reductase family enzyme
VSALALILTALAALCLAFALLYWLARRIDNYGIVDIAWSYAFAALATFYALAGPGWPSAARSSPPSPSSGVSASARISRSA